MTMWDSLTRMSGEECYTLTQRRPATMHVHRGRVTIQYPSGRSLDIERDMIEEAWNKLIQQGTLTIGDAFAITARRDRTDRIMAVLSKLDGVTSSS